MKMLQFEFLEAFLGNTSRQNSDVFVPNEIDPMLLQKYHIEMRQMNLHNELVTIEEIFAFDPYSNLHMNMYVHGKNQNINLVWIFETLISNYKVWTNIQMFEDKSYICGELDDETKKWIAFLYKAMPPHMQQKYIRKYIQSSR